MTQSALSRFAAMLGGTKMRFRNDLRRSTQVRRVGRSTRRGDADIRRRGLRRPPGLASMAHATPLTGFTPKVGIDEGVKALVDWYRSEMPH
jgi:nucleoside-diphosphate-sugar epimerase